MKKTRPKEQQQLHLHATPSARMPSETTSPRRSSPPSAKPLAPPRLPPLAPVSQQPNPSTTQNQTIPQSPVAPAFSPITPRAVPALPAISVPPQPPPPAHNGADENTDASAPAADTSFHPQIPAQPQPRIQQPPQHKQHPEQQSAIAPTQYIPPPPPKPFSSEDSTDAIALRAAISSLQFQKKKAQDDIRTLEKVRKQALDEPERFREELRKGNVEEKRMTSGDVRAILDAESDDDEDDEQQDEGPGQDSKKEGGGMTNGNSTEKHTFDRIPGPQNVIRTPHVNWEKYHVVGEPLDRMHEQQRKWPGQRYTHDTDRGREFSVAAPYSPWLDRLEDASAGADGTVSEHPMETRRGGVRK